MGRPTNDEAIGPVLADRREFLAGATAATLGLASSVAGAATPGVASGLPIWEQTADVVVVGSGAAGFAAAVTARSRGCSVIMLEKGLSYGGTTAKSAGMYWIPNNSFMRARGVDDPRDWALRLMARLAYPALYNPTAIHLGLPPLEHSLLEAFYDRGTEAVDHLGRIGALKTALGTPPAAQNRTDDGRELISWPDYHADVAENKTISGRCLVPSPNGRGRGLVDQMKRHADQQGIPVLLGHRVVGVHRNATNAVVGVQIAVGNRNFAVRARRGVVFASGGFTHNEELRRTYLRGPVLNGYAVKTNTGDLIPIAAGLGADFSNMTQAWWAQQPLELALTDVDIAPDSLNPRGDSMLFVNCRGVRIVNERRQYNERAQAHFVFDANARGYTNLVLFMIYDELTARDADNRFPVPPPGTTAPYVIAGQTWHELAERIDARLAPLVGKTGGLRLAKDFSSHLAQTIDRFNRMAAEGRDLDFLRGDEISEQFFSRPVARPGQKNKALYPLASTGPYYCIPLVAAPLDTKGGPRINANAQILDRAGTPITGLYGAGNCIASPAGEAYFAGGSTLGPALTFGYLAGMHAAGSAETPV